MHIEIIVCSLEHFDSFYKLQRCNTRLPGAGTIKPEIISSLIIGGSDGGGGHTIDSMMSSVVRIRPVNSGGSTRDDLQVVN